MGAVGKCYSLRYFEEVIFDLLDLSENTFRKIPSLGRKRLLLEEIKVVNHRTGVIRNDYDMPIKSDIKKSIKNLHTKKASVSFGISTGWFSISSEFEETTVQFIKSFGLPHFLSHISFKFEGAPLTFEILEALIHVIPGVPLLKFFSLEFLNSRVSETEMMILTQALPRMSHVQQLELKVIQYPNISDGCIYYMVNALSKLKNFTKFDLYFRRLSVTEDVLQELENKLLELEDVKCSRFRESLYIYKDVTA